MANEQVIHPLRARYMLVAAQDRAIRARDRYEAAEAEAMAGTYRHLSAAPEPLVNRWAWAGWYLRRYRDELRRMAMRFQAEGLVP